MAKKWRGKKPSAKHPWRTGRYGESKEVPKVKMGRQPK